MIRLLLGVILLVSFIPMSFQESNDKIISGTKGNSMVNLIFSDGGVSGKILFKDQEITISENSKIIQKKNKTLIFDKQNDLKILFRQITDEKYLIFVKTDDTSIRFVAKEIKNFSQRNLWDELKEKEKPIIDLKLIEKQQEIDEAEKKFQLKIKRLEKNNELNSRTSDSILADYEKSKEITGMSLVTEKVKKNLPLPLKEKEIKAFLSVPHMTAWKDVLRFDVLVTDDTAQRYDGTYKDYIGHKLKDVKIVGKIINPSGEILQKFSGVTDSNGKYKNQYQIIDNSSTRGEYQIIVTATQTIKDSTLKSDVSKVFFVTYPYRDSKNPTVPNAPVLRLENVTATHINLAWDKPYDGKSSIIGYVIERAIEGDVFPNIEEKKLNETTLTFSDEYDITNTTYYYKIFANNAIGMSDQSNEVRVIILNNTTILN